MIKVGDTIRISGETFVGNNKRSTISAKVIKKYRRFALVETDAGYRTTIWIDRRGVLKE